MIENKKNILVTGGAGFIGSNLVKALLSDERVQKITVLDNLTSGFLHNIQEFIGLPNFHFIEGDITNYDICMAACEGVNLVSHQAALGSVPRSIKDPITTDRVNIGGTLNMFQAAKECGVGRIVFAASSSTYGDSIMLPKVEEFIGKPLSPYAITKYVNELYADVYSKTYENFEYIGLRYFNVFGPKQDPKGAYAAVIPLFFKAAIENNSPTINGDGTYSRDFTHISNVVEANIKALFTENGAAINQVYNVACGERTTLLQLWNYIKEAVGTEISPIFGPQRKGDINHSLASIDKIIKLLDYRVHMNVKNGIVSTKDYYKNLFVKTDEN